MLTSVDFAHARPIMLQHSTSILYLLIIMITSFIIIHKSQIIQGKKFWRYVLYILTNVSVLTAIATRRTLNSPTDIEGKQRKRKGSFFFPHTRLLKYDSAR